MQVARRFAGTRLHGAQRRERRKLGGSALPRAEGSALSPFLTVPVGRQNRKVAGSCDG